MGDPLNSTADRPDPYAAAEARRCLAVRRLPQRWRRRAAGSRAVQL